MSLQEVSNTVRFADLELAVLARWERERTFERSNRAPLRRAALRVLRRSAVRDRAAALTATS